MGDFTIVDREVLEVIRERYADLFPAEKKTADFVLQNPPAAVTMNVAELAKASGVSDATIVRLCHHLGYSGYYQFRIALSREIGKEQSRESRVLTSNDAISSMFEEFNTSVTMVGRDLDIETLRGCVSLLKNAKFVHLIAMGNTTTLTRYMGFRLERLGIRSTYTDLPEYFMNHINLAEDGDIVLAITKSGSSRAVLDAMRLAREKKLPAILITAFEDSEAASLADYVLNSRGTNKSRDYYKGYSYLNEFILVETLLGFVVNEELIIQKNADLPELILAENKEKRGRHWNDTPC
ncbi:MAG: MurR/RpiR family transcriptional regulator [Blautia sp.]|nr:MurR/RpiR family transcriptional regulator [Blautia sp.]